MLDGQPFQELAGIVQQLGDERVWTYAEWIGIKFAPRTQGYWAPGDRPLHRRADRQAQRARPLRQPAAAHKAARRREQRGVLLRAAGVRSWSAREAQDTAAQGTTSCCTA